MKSTESLIYLDNNSTTRVDDRVIDAMLPYFSKFYGNAASSHYFGTVIKKEVEIAREKVADFINVNSSDIYFTAGSTEGINIALKGLALSPQNAKRHLITVQTEHKAVLDTCKYLETMGFEVTYLPVKPNGLIDLNTLKAALRPDTLVVVVMYANNETGVMQDIKTISTIAQDSGALFFCDATQAVGKIPIDVLEQDIDLLVFSAHKMYGPKGIGALYVKSNIAKISPLLHGGGHEKGLRSGTLNVPGIIGFGKACEIAKNEIPKDVERITALRNELEKELLKIPGTFINGAIENRMYNVTNICFPGLEANILIGKMKNIVVSNGSACTSAVVEPSHVLISMGLGDENAFASIRVSMGKFNTKEEVNSATQIFYKTFELSRNYL